MIALNNHIKSQDETLQENSRTIFTLVATKTRLEDRVTNLVADLAAAMDRTSTAELALAEARLTATPTSACVPSPTATPATKSEDTSQLVLPKESTIQRLKLFKEKVKKQPSKIKEYGPKAVKTALPTRLVLTKTSMAKSGSKTMKKLKAPSSPSLRLPVSPIPTDDGEGREYDDVAALQTDWGPEDKN